MKRRFLVNESSWNSKNGWGGLWGAKSRFFTHNGNYDVASYCRCQVWYHPAFTENKTKPFTGQQCLETRAISSDTAIGILGGIKDGWRILSLKNQQLPLKPDFIAKKPPDSIPWLKAATTNISVLVIHHVNMCNVVFVTTVPQRISSAFFFQTLFDSTAQAQSMIHQLSS